MYCRNTIKCVAEISTYLALTIISITEDDFTKLSNISGQQKCLPHSYFPPLGFCCYFEKAQKFVAKG